MPKKILIVDDEDSLRKSMAIMLRLKGGYEVFEAADGLEGLDVATANIPDLIISDVYMDNMNGFMMVEEIQQQPSTRDIPIIMMTSAAQAAGAWKSGAAVEYLDKGFTLVELLDVVKRIIKE